MNQKQAIPSSNHELELKIARSLGLEVHLVSTDGNTYLYQTREAEPIIVTDDMRKFFNPIPAGATLSYDHKIVEPIYKNWSSSVDDALELIAQMPLSTMCPFTIFLSSNRSWTVQYSDNLQVEDKSLATALCYIWLKYTEQNEMQITKCKYCGGEGKIEIRSNVKQDCVVHREVYFVRCQTEFCQATGPIALSRKVAIQIWNRDLKENK